MNLIQIDNRKGKLKLNDGVHKESADKLIEELGTLYGPAAVLANMRIGDVVCAADDALESVEVEINSPGGSVFEGQRIYSALREMSSRGVEITTTVSGLAASMGSVILMAGDKRAMTKGSRIMIHEASTMAYGDAKAMQRSADLLESISSEIAGIYAERTGNDKKELRDLMFSETWMDAEKAKSLGFVHAVLSYDKKDKAKAEFDTAGKGMSIFARLFPDNADAVAKLDAMLEENETLRADLIAAQARVADLAPLAEANLALHGEVAALTAGLTEADTALQTATAKITELEASAEKVDDLAAIKAAELLSAQGHPAPVSLVGDSAEPTDHLKILATLSGSERTKYYAENGIEIRKQLTK
jgi:ATP-dependent Clp endopeptidase proteolytic subunit ClpP